MEHNQDSQVSGVENGRDRSVDWSRFGLNGNREERRNGQRDSSTYDGFGHDIYPTGANELFAQEYVSLFLCMNISVTVDHFTSGLSR